MEPTHVDVNIHPTKHEVKFLHEHDIMANIRRAFEKELTHSNQARKFYIQQLLPGASDPLLNLSEDSDDGDGNQTKESKDKSNKPVYDRYLVRSDFKEQKLQKFFGNSMPKSMLLSSQSSTQSTSSMETNSEPSEMNSEPIGSSSEPIETSSEPKESSSEPMETNSESFETYFDKTLEAKLDSTSDSTLDQTSDSILEPIPNTTSDSMLDETSDSILESITADNLDTTMDHKFVSISETKIKSKSETLIEKPKTPGSASRALDNTLFSQSLNSSLDETIRLASSHNPFRVARAGQNKKY